MEAVDHVPELLLLVPGQGPVVVSSDQGLHLPRLKIRDLESILRVMMEYLLYHVMPGIYTI